LKQYSNLNVPRLPAIGEVRGGYEDPNSVYDDALGVETGEDALLRREAINLWERRPERPVLSKEVGGNVRVRKEAAGHPAPKGLVQRVKHIRRMVECKSCEKDARRRLAEQVPQHNGCVTSFARARLWPRPDELRWTCAIESLSKCDTKDGERTLLAEPIEPVHLVHKFLEPFGLHREPRQRKGDAMGSEGSHEPLKRKRGDAG
jgi:hypothetical protein